MRKNVFKKYIVGLALACIACVCCILGINRPTSIQQASAATAIYDSSDMTMKLGDCSFFLDSADGEDGPGVSLYFYIDRMTLFNFFGSEFAYSYTSDVSLKYGLNGGITSNGGYHYDVASGSYITRSLYIIKNTFEHSDIYDKLKSECRSGIVSAFDDSYFDAIWPFKGPSVPSMYDYVSEVFEYGCSMAPLSFSSHNIYYVICIENTYTYTCKSNFAAVLNSPEDIKTSDNFDCSISQKIIGITNNYYDCDIKAEAEQQIKNCSSGSNVSFLSKYWKIYSGEYVTDDDMVPITIKYKEWSKDASKFLLVDKTKVFYIQKYYCLSEQPVNFFLNEAIREAYEDGISNFNVKVEDKFDRLDGASYEEANGANFTYRTARGLKNYTLSSSGGSCEVDYGNFDPAQFLLRCDFVLYLYDLSHSSGYLSSFVIFLHPQSVKLKSSGLYDVIYSAQDIVDYLSEFYAKSKISPYCDLTTVDIVGPSALVANCSKSTFTITGSLEDLAACRATYSLRLDTDNQMKVNISYTTYSLNGTTVNETTSTVTLKTAMWRSNYYKLNYNSLLNVYNGVGNSYGLSETAIRAAFDAGKITLTDGSQIDYAEVVDINKGSVGAASTEVTITVSYRKHSLFRIKDVFGNETDYRYEIVPNTSGNLYCKNYIKNYGDYAVCNITSDDTKLATISKATDEKDFANYKINVKCSLTSGSIIPITIEYGEYVSVMVEYYDDIVDSNKNPTGFATKELKGYDSSKQLINKTDLKNYDINGSISEDELANVLNKFGIIHLNEGQSVFDAIKDYTYAYGELDETSPATIYIDQGTYWIKLNYKPATIKNNSGNKVADVNITCANDWFGALGLSSTQINIKGLKNAWNEVYGYFYVNAVDLDTESAEELMSGYTSDYGRGIVAKSDYAIYVSTLNNLTKGKGIIFGNWDKTANDYIYKSSSSGSNSYVSYFGYLDGTKSAGSYVVNDDVTFAKIETPDPDDGSSGGSGSTGDPSGGEEPDDGGSSSGGDSSGGGSSSGGDSSGDGTSSGGDSSGGSGNSSSGNNSGNSGTSSDASTIFDDDSLNDIVNNLDTQKIMKIVGGCSAGVFVVSIFALMIPNFSRSLKGLRKRSNDSVDLENKEVE